MAVSTLDLSALSSSPSRRGERVLPPRGRCRAAAIGQWERVAPPPRCSTSANGRRRRRRLHERVMWRGREGERGGTRDWSCNTRSKPKAMEEKKGATSTSGRRRLWISC